MIVGLVAAVAADGAIGRAGGLLFTDAEDRRHFRATTADHPVVMGRRTWLSLPERFRPLPGRRNMVLSRDAGFSPAGAEVAPDLDTAIKRLAGHERVFVIGGAEVYTAALPRADELILTEVDRGYDSADTFFPRWNRAEFDEAERRPHRAADGTAFSIVTYRRRR